MNTAPSGDHSDPAVPGPSRPRGSAAIELVRRSGMMVAARAVQSVAGVLSFVIMTRHLGVAGFGELVTALAVAGIVGGILATALSDTQVVSASARSRWPESYVLAAWLTISAAAAAVLWLTTTSLDAALAAGGVGLYVGLSTATTGRVTAARARGNARGLAWVSAVGGLASLLLVAALVAFGVEAWGAFAFPIAAQPLILFVLPRAEPVEPDAPGGERAPHPWIQSLPYVLSQASWLVVSQAPVFLLRIFAGPRAVGEYGAITRLLDLLGLISPLMGTFALPEFVKQYQRGGARGRLEVARLNGLIGVVGTLPVLVGAYFGWWAYQWVYPDEPFPVLAFVILTAATGLSTACGLPDRVLQGQSRASAVSVIGIGSAVVMLTLGVPATIAAGLIGASFARLVAIGGANVFLLRASRLPGDALMIHVAVAFAMLGACVVTGLRLSDGSFIQSSASALLTAIATCLLVAPWWRRLGRSLLQLDASSTQPVAPATEGPTPLART